jgi:hypothetical protein
MKRLYYRLYIRYLAIQWLFQMNLGDQVLHDGKVRYIINWAGTPYMTLDNPYQQNVPAANCKKIMSISNLWHSYKAGVQFYTSSWLDIWVNNGIEPWVRALQIWPRK